MNPAAARPQDRTMSTATDQDVPLPRGTPPDTPAESTPAEAQDSSLDQLLGESLTHLEHQVEVTRDYLARYEPSVPATRTR